MRALLLLSGLVLTAGCDDPAVRDRIDSILDHGALKARATCTAVVATSCTGYTFNQTLDFAKLVDGSVLVSTKGAGQDARLSTFCGRSENCADPPQWRAPVFSDTAVFSLHDGLFEITVDSSTVNVYCGHTPHTFFSADIDVACTGFNLEAFE